MDAADTPVEKRPRVRYGPVEAVTVTVIVFFLAQIVVGVGVGLVFSLLGWQEARIGAWYKTPFGQFSLILLVEALTLWLIWWFLRRRKTRLSAIGLVGPQSRDVLFALAGFGVYFVAFIVVSALAKSAVPGLDLEQEQQLGFDKALSGNALWLVFASLVILPPVTEEIVCRGFLYTGLRTRLPVITAAIITSVLFALAHLQWGSGNALLWVAALDTFVLSMVLVYLREKTGSVWSPILVHMIKNGLAFTVLFVLKL